MHDSCLVGSRPCCLSEFIPSRASVAYCIVMAERGNEDLQQFNGGGGLPVPLREEESVNLIWSSLQYLFVIDMRIVQAFPCRCRFADKENAPKVEEEVSGSLCMSPVHS